jgi:hypothetical protein
MSITLSIESNDSISIRKVLKAYFNFNRRVFTSFRIYYPIALITQLEYWKSTQYADASMMMKHTDRSKLGLKLEQKPGYIYVHYKSLSLIETQLYLFFENDKLYKTIFEVTLPDNRASLLHKAYYTARKNGLAEVENNLC